MNILHLVYFSVAWLLAFYIFNCVLARKIIRVDFPTAILYASSVTLLGVFAEVMIGSLYQITFDGPLWEYRLLPIHNAYTSYYSIFIWSSYGFYLYLLHGSLNSKVTQTDKKLALIVAVEALVIEILFNITHIYIFGEYIFYYFPSELWHLTSIQAIPIYLLAGFIVTKSIRRFKKDITFFILLNCTLVIVFTFFAHS